MGTSPRSPTRRQKPPSRSAFSTGHAGDDQLLEILSERSDLASPRHWVHFLYFPDESSARTAAASVEEAGWALQAVQPAATDNGDWIVIAERHDAVVSPDAVMEARISFESIVAAHPGADYDGWEASL
ncbi:ribonuclease E inhibitor RraB [Microcella humidisoli]|uniref:Ribonuclease E inhibitor RraB n=1 Tax=Microcella humidisoli TaxID=2963406 RepID=A0ABY5FUE9_9MICO|nr:ribonuclease E inhibitor RraB [Microcella humidisoli]UTT61936.1 ribonuclease E inhibitor RraB [Microcella humidisoli]